MKAFTFYTTAKIVLAYGALIFSLAFLFTSCEIQRDCPGAGRKAGFSGYASKPSKPITGPKGHSF